MNTETAREKTPGFDDENKILDVYRQIGEAIAGRDFDALLHAYATDVVMYDARDNLRYQGRPALRKSWEECFDSSKHFRSDIHDLKLTIRSQVAFGFALSHATGTTNDGDPIDLWLRVTTCFEKRAGRWVIAHEHVSVPGDFRTGKLLQDLKPESSQFEH